MSSSFTWYFCFFITFTKEFALLLVFVCLQVSSQATTIFEWSSWLLLLRSLMTIVAGNESLVRSRSSKYELHVDVMMKDHTGVPLTVSRNHQGIVKRCTLIDSCLNPRKCPSPAHLPCSVFLKSPLTYNNYNTSCICCFFCSKIAANVLSGTIFQWRISLSGFVLAELWWCWQMRGGDVLYLLREK